MVGHCSLEEVEDDLNQVDRINDILDCDEINLAWLVIIGEVVALLILILIESWEDKNEGNDEHVVNSEESDHEVPRFAEGSLRVDEIPLELGVLTVLLMVSLI
jgi:hypothetical protein